MSEIITGLGGGLIGYAIGTRQAKTELSPSVEQSDSTALIAENARLRDQLEDMQIRIEQLEREIAEQEGITSGDGVAFGTHITRTVETSAPLPNQPLPLKQANSIGFSRDAYGRLFYMNRQLPLVNLYTAVSNGSKLSYEALTGPRTYDLTKQSFFKTILGPASSQYVHGIVLVGRAKRSTSSRTSGSVTTYITTEVGLGELATNLVIGCDISDHQGSTSLTAYGLVSTLGHHGLSVTTVRRIASDAIFIEVIPHPITKQSSSRASYYQKAGTTSSSSDNTFYFDNVWHYESTGTSQFVLTSMTIEAAGVMMNMSRFGATHQFANSNRPELYCCAGEEITGNTAPRKSIAYSSDTSPTFHQYPPTPTDLSTGSGFTFQADVVV